MNKDVANIIRVIRNEFEQRRSERITVAFSGGRDSSVLLHLLARHSDLPVDACYVAHGLQDSVTASAWLQHLQQFCAGLDVALTTLTVTSLQEGGNTEARARAARYEALSSLPGRRLLLLAQHQDDQAETVLLQLLRGSGPAGLSGMPRAFSLGSHGALRPLLRHDRAWIESYATTYDVAHFEDPSNADQSIDRNYLRHTVMPMLQERWPGMSRTVSRAADWQQQSQRVLDQTAARDARHVLLTADRCSVSRLRQLPTERQRNVLRFVVRWLAMSPVPASRLESVLGLIEQKAGRGEVAWEEVRVRRYRDGLYLLRERPAPPDAFVRDIRLQEWVELPGDLGRYRV
ncbi:MAG: tRNA lysidine(34) synthetase TilS, partial [Pseudomonadota bacterium]